jgi:hypothetical protein
MSILMYKIPITDEDGSQRIVSAPRMHCDRCGKPIEKPEEGMFLWDAENLEPGPIEKTICVHKGVCDPHSNDLPFSQEVAVGLAYMLRAAGYFDEEGEPTLAWHDVWHRASLLSNLG